MCDQLIVYHRHGDVSTIVCPHGSHRFILQYRDGLEELAMYQAAKWVRIGMRKSQWETIHACIEFNRPSTCPRPNAGSGSARFSWPAADSGS